MSPADHPIPPLRYSKTQRIVFLIDLQPLIITSSTSTDYISTVISATSRLLRFPPLSSSLFSYKFFFSSQSILRTASILPRHLSTPSLSFNLPSQTLDSLSSDLRSISINSESINHEYGLRAACTASSLLQLIHCYAWENQAVDLQGKDSLCGDFEGGISSNLVVLFSRIVDSIKFLDVIKFGDVFSDVRKGFISRDIHLCWIDVVESVSMKMEGVNQLKSSTEFDVASLSKNVKKMGWGFCSSDSIILGSALLPFGLIYPKIGVPFDLVHCPYLENRRYGAFSLEIFDKSKSLIDWKCCDLEFVSLPRCTSTKADNALESEDLKSAKCGQDMFSRRFGNGNVKLCIKKVHTYDECDNIGGISDILLVRDCIQGSEKKIKKTDGDLFADRVLEMLCEQMGGVNYRRQLPAWQILLSFLYSRGYWALVSISDNNGDTYMGSLKPFTSHLAILSVFSAGYVSMKSAGRSKLRKVENLLCDSPTEDINDSNSCFGSQTESSTSVTCEQSQNRKKKRSKRYQYQEMKWNSFCEAAIGGTEFDLFEVYSGKQFERSRNLKFLSCWMRDIPNHDPHGLITLQGSKSMEELANCNTHLSEPYQTEEGDTLVSNRDTLESFFNNISKTIRHSLESDSNLQNVAKRVVRSSINWLQLKYETENNAEGVRPSRILNEPSIGYVLGKLMKHLLMKPKAMKKIPHGDTSSSKASDSCTSQEIIVREYELQILLRMEILQSDVSGMIDESRKEKLVKQACSLLEIIQYLRAGGLHGDISLYDYVEQTIKARYSDTLEDVVKTIYSELELDLPFSEGDAPNHLFFSEDSNQSWRDIQDKHVKAENNNLNNRSASTDGDSLPLENLIKGLEEDGERDRIAKRRLVSFKSRAPDLQRVWAPKQAKVVKGKKLSTPIKKSKGRKSKRRVSDSVVCETPMTGNQKQVNIGSSSYTVSKALFQDI